MLYLNLSAYRAPDFQNSEPVPRAGAGCGPCPCNGLSKHRVHLVTVQTPLVASSKFPLIATGFGKFVTLNMRLIIPQWHSELFRAWQTLWNVWTAPCPTGRKNNCQAVPGRSRASIRQFFWRKQFCWLEQDFADNYLAYMGCSFLKTLNISFTFTLVVFFKWN